MGFTKVLGEGRIKRHREVGFALRKVLKGVTNYLLLTKDFGSEDHFCIGQFWQKLSKIAQKCY